MPVSELDQMLFDSAEVVLETMFFTSLVGDAEPGVAGAPGISASLSFQGKPSGSFGVRVSLETGRKIASSFLGVEEEELTDSQIGEVICELANMLCGSVVSRLESTSTFELSHPELDSGENLCPQGDSGSCRILEIDEGTLHVWAKLDAA